MYEIICLRGVFTEANKQLMVVGRVGSGGYGGRWDSRKSDL